MAIEKQLVNDFKKLNPLQKSTPDQRALLKVQTTGVVQEGEIAKYVRNDNGTIIESGTGIFVDDQGNFTNTLYVESASFNQIANRSYTVVVPSAGVITLDCSLGQNFLVSLTESITSIVITNEDTAFEQSTILTLDIQATGLTIDLTGYLSAATSSDITLSQTVGALDIFAFSMAKDITKTIVVYKRGFQEAAVTSSSPASSVKKTIRVDGSIINNIPKLKNRSNHVAASRSFLRKGPEPKAFSEYFFDTSFPVVENSLLAIDRTESGGVIHKCTGMVSPESGVLSGNVNFNSAFFTFVRYPRVVIDVNTGVATVDCNSAIHTLDHDEDISFNFVNVPSIPDKLFAIKILREKDASETVRNIDWEASNGEFLNAPSNDALTQTPGGLDVLFLTTVDGGVAWSVVTDYDLREIV